MSNPNLPDDSWGIPPEYVEMLPEECWRCDYGHECPCGEHCFCDWHDKFVDVDGTCDHFCERTEVDDD